jgi:hypothetical protein
MPFGINNKITDDYGRIWFIKTQPNILPIGASGVLETYGFKPCVLRSDIDHHGINDLPYSDYVIDCIKKYLHITDT